MSYQYPDKLTDIAVQMAEIGVQAIKLDKQGRIVYICYSECKPEYKLSVHTTDSPGISEIKYPFEESQCEDPYDDPDMWQDGQRPTFSKKG